MNHQIEVMLGEKGVFSVDLENSTVEGFIFE